MNNKVYKMGIVGYGGMANWHRKLIQTGNPNQKTEPYEVTNPLGIEIKGIFDIAQRPMKKAIEDGLQVYKSFEEMLSDEEIDIILCATPNEVHKDTIVRALEAGKHAVSEKPVTVSSKDLQEMIDASERTGNVFVVHQNRRWDGDFLTLQDVYKKGLLGEIFEIQSRIHGSRGIPGDWRGKKENGGGMMLDWGVHIIDQMLLMIDDKIDTVYATMDHVTTDEVDDGFRMILTFKGGLRILFEVGTSNFISLPRFYALGTDGTLKINKLGNIEAEVTRITDKTKNDAKPIITAAGLTKTMAPRTAETTMSEIVSNKWGNIKEFYANLLNTIEGKETQIVKLEQVMRVMKVMEASFESDKLGQIIKFEE